MKNWFYFIKLGISCIPLVSCDELKPTQVEEKTILFKKEGTLTVLKFTGEIAATFDVEIADNPYERQTGLMYRNLMQKHQGMLFIFEQAQVLNFYMKNTPLALDLIFLNERLEIIHFHKNALPNDPSPISSLQAAKYVFEIKAGLSDQFQFEIGDRINYKRF